MGRGSRKTTTGEKNGFALDHCSNSGDFVALGNGELVHARRICSHSAGAGNHSCVDPRNSGATAGLAGADSRRVQQQSEINLYEYMCKGVLTWTAIDH